MIETIFIVFFSIYFIYQGAFIAFKTSLFFFLAFYPIFNSNKYGIISISRNFANIIFIWMAYFSFSFLLAIINKFQIPNFKLFFNILLLIPLCYSAAFLANYKFSLLSIYKILISITSICLLLTYVVFFLDFYGLRDNFFIFKTIFTNQTFGGLVNLGDRLSFRTNSVALIYLYPFNLHLLFNSYKFLSNKFQNLLKINIIIGLIFIVLSGRRALQYITFLSLFNLILPFLLSKKNYFFLLIKKLKGLFKPRLFNFFIFILFIFSIYWIFKILTENTTVDVLFDRFTSTLFAPFDPEQGTTSTRIMQYGILINGWFDSPFIGHGLTSFPELFFRQSYHFEAILHAKLFQTGLIGTTVYFSFIYYCLFGKNLPSIKAISNYKPSQAIPFASFWFFFASMTNPFGYNLAVWIIMIYYRIGKENGSINNLIP